MAKRSSKHDLGLDYRAFDLHVHTPASDDFKDRSASPSDVIEAALCAHLDGICVTDHNTAEFVDQLTEAAKGKPVTVFPGLEISVTGGKEGPIHIVGIFRPGTTTEELSDLLSNVGLTKAKRGRLDELADGEPNTIIHAILKHNGIPVLAHADSSHGVLHDMKGQPRLKVLRNQKLVAAEVSKDNYKKVLDGSDPEYKRSLATYEASDAHSLSEIGTRRTYFKVASATLDALRQCFYDPQVRIRCQPEFEGRSSTTYPRILEVNLDSGFFASETLTLHPCQNCLIGGQGVGKSLLVEFIRFALDQLSPIDQVQQDTEAKLQQQLGLGGKVLLKLQLASGTKYQVSRAYDGRSNPIEVVNLDTGEYYDGSIAQLFPIVAYSQTETVQISRNPAAQLELIDRFIDAPQYHFRISQIHEALRKNDNRVAQLADAKEQLAGINKQISTIIEALANTEKALQSPILAEMKTAEEQKAAFDAEQTFHDDFTSQLKEMAEEIEQSNKPPSLPKKFHANDGLVEANSISRSTFQTVLSDLRATTEKIQAARKGVGQLYKQWRPQLQQTQRHYDEFIQASGGDQKSLAAKRKKLESQKEELEAQAKTLSSQAVQFDKIWKARLELLDQLDQARVAFYTTRKAKYDELAAESQGKLHLEISMATNANDFAQALAEIATGTRIRKADLTLIAAKITPRDFVAAVVEHNPSLISQSTGVDEDTATKLVDWLNSLEAQETVLALQHQYLPQDSPSIQFRKDDGKYYPISDLSVGQKCTALLIIALSASNYPIIIDQPEEAIDIASVFADVVSKLRSSKDGRQFTLTTHNPNIAVTADSDLIHVLKASATKGRIVNAGAIEDEDVRKEVIDHLEGGRIPYLMRGRKYGFLVDETGE
jgi:hypothetical protein